MRKELKRIALTMLALLAMVAWMPVVHSADETAGQKLDRATDQPGQTAADVMNKATPAGQAVTAPAAGALPSGITPKEFNIQGNVAKAFARVTEAALTDGKWNEVLDQLATSDKKRIGDLKLSDMGARGAGATAGSPTTPATPAETTRSDSRSSGQSAASGLSEETSRATLTQFSQAWKSKYNDTFSIKNEDQVFGKEYFNIKTGEISDGNALSSQWPLKASARAGSMSGAGAVGAAGAAGAASPVAGDNASKELENGRNVAVVTLPAEGTLPELTVSMIHEMPDSWKIDIPDNIDKAQIQSSLSQHINQISQMSSQWPADQQQAQRIVTRHILMALYNVSSQGGQQH